MGNPYENITIPLPSYQFNGNITYEVYLEKGREWNKKSSSAPMEKCGATKSGKDCLQF